jgi:hypothetical protein
MPVVIALPSKFGIARLRLPHCRSKRGALSKRRAGPPQDGTCIIGKIVEPSLFGYAHRPFEKASVFNACSDACPVVASPDASEIKAVAKMLDGFSGKFLGQFC